jgi:hypothetical protein
MGRRGKEVFVNLNHSHRERMRSPQKDEYAKPQDLECYTSQTAELSFSSFTWLISLPLKILECILGWQNCQIFSLVLMGMRKYMPLEQRPWLCTAN